MHEHPRINRFSKLRGYRVVLFAFCGALGNLRLRRGEAGEFCCEASGLAVEILVGRLERARRRGKADGIRPARQVDIAVRIQCHVGAGGITAGPGVGRRTTAEVSRV